MKKRFICIGLLILAILFIALSLFLTIKGAMSKNIIGGAGLPTLTFVFFRENDGLCFYLAICSLLCAALSVVVKFIKK